MRIAVTGASGFIGKELLAVLREKEDIEITALSRDASACEASEGVEWRSTDYSADSLASVLRDADAVIHLAGVRGTENDPAKFAVNAEMTANILKAMAECGVKRIVFASTVSVYNDESLMPWTEDAPLRGRTCYGDSKADCEDLIREYAGRCGFTYGIARIAQVVGEGEKRRGMMNVFIDTAREHGSLKVMGRSIFRKQYIYVGDLVRVLALLAAESDRDIIVNTGMRKAYSSLEVARIVNEVFENPSPVDYDDSYPEKGRPFHMDISRLREELRYEPLDLKDALKVLAAEGRR